MKVCIYLPIDKTYKTQTSFTWFMTTFLGLVATPHPTRFPFIVLTTNFSLRSDLYCLCCRNSNSKRNRTSLMSSSLRLLPAIRCLPGCSFGTSPSLTPLPPRPPTASCSTGEEGQWLTALSVLHAFSPPRCYTKKTWGQELQYPSLPRWRESNTIKRTLARYWK